MKTQAVFVLACLLLMASMTAVAATNEQRKTHCIAKAKTEYLGEVSNFKKTYNRSRRSCSGLPVPDTRLRCRDNAKRTHDIRLRNAASHLRAMIRYCRSDNPFINRPVRKSIVEPHRSNR